MNARDTQQYERCEHGFLTCYACKHEAVVPGCYYPGCEGAKDERDKMCPEHGGRWSAHAVLDGDEEYEVERR